MNVNRDSRLVQSIALHTTVPVVAWAFLSVLATREGVDAGTGRSLANALIARLLRAHTEALSPGLWSRAVEHDAAFTIEQKKKLPPGQEVSPIERGAELVEWIKREMAGGGR